MAGIWQQAEELIVRLQAQSRDRDYTQYLEQLKKEIPSWQTEALWGELRRTYELYLQRNPGTVRDEELSKELYTSPLNGPALKGSREFQSAGRAQDSGERWGSASVSAAPGQEPSHASQASHTSQASHASHALQPSHASHASHASQARSVEATVGMVLFGGIGGLFILSALAILGNVYMDDLGRRICLYVLSLVLLILSEFVLDRKNKNLGQVASFVGASGMYLALILYYRPREILLVVGAMTVTALLCLSISLLPGRRGRRWYYYYILQAAVAALFIFYYEDRGFSGTGSVAVLAALFLLLLSKALTGIKVLAADEGVITALACGTVLIFRREPLSLVLAAALLLSLALLHRSKTYYEILIAGTLLIYLCGKIPAVLRLPVGIGTCFAFLLLVHSVKRFQGKNVFLFDLFMFAGQGTALLLMNVPPFRGTPLLRIIVLIFGLATILLLFQEKYGIAPKYRELILVVFLTYMILLPRTLGPLFGSILLMVVALLSVLLGFWKKKRSVRIYGLILSLVVCCKLVFLDFASFNILQRTAVFLVVGVLALLIAGGYLLLEKKMS